MAKKSPAEQRKTVDDEWIRISFHKETAFGLLKLFNANSKFREHNRNAVTKIKLMGESMIKGVKKFWLNMFFMLIIFSILLASCSDNSVTPTNTNPTPTPNPYDTILLFSYDSLGLSSSDSGNVGLKDSVLYDIDTSATKIKLKYYMQSTGGIPPSEKVYYGVFISKPGISFFADYDYLYNNRIIDTSRIFDISSYKGITLKFKVAIDQKINHNTENVFFKNMKLYSIVDTTIH